MHDTIIYIYIYYIIFTFNNNFTHDFLLLLLLRLSNPRMKLGQVKIAKVQHTELYSTLQK